MKRKLVETFSKSESEERFGRLLKAALITRAMPLKDIPRKRRKKAGSLSASRQRRGKGEE